MSSPLAERRAAEPGALAAVAISTMVIATTFLLLVAALQRSVSGRSFISIGAVLAIGGAALWLARRGSVRIGGWVLVLGLSLLVTYNAIPAGGIRSPGISAYVVFVLMGGFLLGQRAGIILGAACAALGFLLLVGEWTGRIPAVGIDHQPISRWLLVCLYISIAITLQRMAFRSMRRALQRADEELADRRAAQERLALAHEAGGIGVWERDVGADTIRFDKRLHEIYGFEPSPTMEVPRDEILARIHPDDVGKVVEGTQERELSLGKSRVEFRLRLPDGRQRHLEYAAMTMADGAGKAVRHVGMTMDVTERREAERERERLLGALKERVKELSLLHGAARYLERDRPVDATFLRELAAMIPSAWRFPEVCVVRITYRDLVVTTEGWRETPWTLVSPIRSAGGTGRVEVAYLEPRAEADEGPFLGEERAVLDSFVELLEVHLDRDYAESLRRTVEGQLRQSQKMEALGTLAGGIAHDFNNILTAISGNARLANDLLSADDPAREHVEEVVKASVRATDLVRQILAFSRKQEAKRRPLRLQGVVEEVRKLLRTGAPPNVAIESEAGADLPAVLADASQLHQVITNLGTNAIHAMRERGGSLLISLAALDVVEPPSVGTIALREGRYIRLRVRDTGTGMSREVLERVFEPFFSTKGQGGTGLGLAVVHGIIQEHEGVIDIDSKVGVGTTIDVFLPAIAGEAITEDRPAPIPRGNGQHILYVDDEEAVLFVMTRMLRRLGYEVTGFTDPHAAVQAFRTAPSAFHAVVSDYQMPGMSGAALARALREIRPDIPIAQASGHRLDDSPGADGVILLQKPVSLEELAQVIHRMVSA